MNEKNFRRLVLVLGVLAAFGALTRVAFAPESTWIVHLAEFRIGDGWGGTCLGWAMDEEAHGGGVHHIRVDESWVYWQYRRVYNSVEPYEDVTDIGRIHFYPTGNCTDPNHTEHVPTRPPRVWPHTVQYDDIAGETPRDNPTFDVAVITVAASLTIPAIPRNTGDPGTTLQYAIEPPGVILANVPYPLLIDLWDPSNANHRKKWYLSARTGSLAWNGMLDHYCYPEEIMPDEADVAYCRASKLFYRITVRVQDRQFSGETLYTMDKNVIFEPADLAIVVTNMACEPTRYWPDIEAGQSFSIFWAPSGGYSPIAFELRADRAFNANRPIPCDASHLIHPVGSFFWPPGAPNPVVQAAYETGSRVAIGAVPGSDLGQRTIQLDGWDGQLIRKTATMNLTVMRTAELTGYFSPHEANPTYVGDSPWGGEYDAAEVSVGGQTIYVDGDFLSVISTEGFGKIYRLRLNENDPFEGDGEDPPEDRRYISRVTGSWQFYDGAYDAQTPAGLLSIDSAARNVDPNLSYYNNMGGYTVRRLNEFGSLYIDNWPNPEAVPSDPPDGRVVDDSGHHNVPHWLDIYFTESEALYGVDPELIRGFGGSKWNQIHPTFPDEPIRVYR